MPRRAFLLALGLVPLLLAGCGGGGSTGTVTGDVTLDGQPMKKGAIQFVPADGKSAEVGADIIDGKYSVVVPVGDMQVKITSDIVTGKRKLYDTADSPTVEDTKQVVLAKYNAATTLKVTVKGGSQTERFDVHSK